MNCKCKDCGFEWESTPEKLYKTKGCKVCLGLKITHEKFVDELSKSNPTVEVLGKYKDGRTHIDCRCRICGYNWSVLASSLRRGCACPECGKKKGSDATRKPHEQFISDVAQTSPMTTVIGIYKGSHFKILCQCKICNNEWNAWPNSLIRGSGCPKCANKKEIGKSAKTHEQFTTELSDINPNVNIIEKYINSKTKINCHCNICGNEWKAAPNNLLNGHGCPSCNHIQTSFAEKSILLFLQKTLGETNVLSRDRTAIGKELDIYIPSLNAAVEFGSWYWHKHRVKKDKEKLNLCRQNNIKLLIIYDGVNEDVGKYELNNDAFVVSKYNLGEQNTRQLLKRHIVDIYSWLGIDYVFDESEERDLFLKAKTITTRRTNDQFKQELFEINPNIEPLSPYRGVSERVRCRCKVCEYEWNAGVSNLLSQKQGCPMCNRKHKRVVNLDTGETYESARGASLQLGLPIGAIGYACRKSNKTYDGHHWAYLEELSQSQFEELYAKYPNTFTY
jgi:hypothetical protein